MQSQYFTTLLMKLPYFDFFLLRQFYFYACLEFTYAVGADLCVCPYKIINSADALGADTLFRPDYKYKLTDTQVFP